MHQQGSVVPPNEYYWEITIDELHSVEELLLDNYYW
jgi:hypothetical protein